MKHHRIEENNEIVGYSKTNTETNEVGFTEITEDEYNTAIAELQSKVEAEAEVAELSKDERIAELEAENAALLYQVLTGEELADV